MDIEIITYQVKQIRETQIYDIAHMRNLKNTRKRLTDPENTLMTTKEKVREG